MTARVQAATAGLLVPPVHDLGDGAVTRVRARLKSGIIDAIGGPPPGAPLEVGVPLLRRARYRPELLGLADEPFAWKPAFVRRSLGLEVVRACASGRFRGPLAAVGPVADHAVESWRRTGWRTFHWEPWLAGLGAGARSVVLAEAVAWVTPVWSTFDWTALRDVVDLGGPDDRWACPGVSVHLKGRVEARVRRHGARPSLLSVASGCPGNGWRDELAFLALIGALAVPDRPVASRVVGLWPESGFRLAVEVDEAALSGAVDRVVDAVAMCADVRTAGPVPVLA
ncbi:MAG TPA: hypothetical protein VIH95_01020 [Acidimicrobiales bacterium]